jgi:hypothetical protein
MLSIRIVIPACPEPSFNSIVYKGTIPDPEKRFGTGKPVYPDGVGE